MKKFTYYVASLLLAGSLWTSCSDSDDSNQTIQLIGGTTTQQVVYADETNKNEGIKFTAAAPWTATVTEVNAKARASQVSWLTLSAYEGGAGEQKLTLTLQPNLTGADRAAEIAITCGETVIRIRVEQKGVKQDGQKPQGAEMLFVTSIVEKTNNSMSGEPYYVTELSYNKEGKLTKTETYCDSNRNGIVDASERGDLTSLQELTYNNAARTVTVTMKNDIQNGEAYYTEIGTYQLNDKGYVVSGSSKETSKFGESSEYTLNVTYNAEGYVTSSKTSWKEGNATTQREQKGTWNQNNLVEVQDMKDGKVVEFTNVTYSNLANPSNLSIDLNFIFAISDSYLTCGNGGRIPLSIAGLTGKRSAKLLEKESYKYNLDSPHFEEAAFQYKTDKNGVIESVTTTEGSESYTYELKYKK